MRHRRSNLLLSLAISLAAVGGIAATLLPDYRQAASLAFVACDFKTLYTAIALNAAGRDPYQPASFAAIYQRDHVVLPPSWFGRMPVYPPVTLDLLSPLATLPMTRAAAVWLAISVVLAILTLMLMLEFAREHGAEPWRRIVLAGCFAGLPLLASALDLGNMSAAATCLALSAPLLHLLQPEDGRPLVPAACLALALCLKPHVALWVLIAMALAASRRGRMVAALATAFSFALTAISATHLWYQHRLGSTLASFTALLHSEQGAGGSMAPTSREALSVTSQVTSAWSLFGLWLPRRWSALAAAACLLGLGALLVAGLLRIRRARSAVATLLVASALSAFGLVLTYHRAHDGLLLSVALLVLVLPHSRSPRDWATAGFFAGSFLLLCFDLPTGGWFFALHERQAGLATMGTAVGLALMLLETGFKQKKAA